MLSYLEGRYRVSECAILPNDKIFPDWKVFRFFFLTKKLFINSTSNYFLNPSLIDGINYNCWFLSFLNNFDYISKLVCVSGLNTSDFDLNLNNYLNPSKYYVYSNLINKTILNYYISDIFCKYSKIMALSASKINLVSFISDNSVNFSNELSSYKLINKNFLRS